MNDYQKKLKLAFNNTWPLTGHKYAAILRKHVENGDLQVIESVNRDGYHMEPIPFTDPMSTSTYDRCLSAELNSKEVITVSVYDGDLMYGQPTKIRAMYRLSGKWWLCKELASIVDEAFRMHTDSLRIQEEEAEKEKRRKVIAEELLKNFKEKK